MQVTCMPRLLNSLAEGLQGLLHSAPHYPFVALSLAFRSWVNMRSGRIVSSEWNTQGRISTAYTCIHTRLACSLLAKKNADVITYLLTDPVRPDEGLASPEQDNVRMLSCLLLHVLSPLYRRRCTRRGACYCYCCHAGTLSTLCLERGRRQLLL